MLPMQCQSKSDDGIGLQDPLC